MFDRDDPEPEAALEEVRREALAFVGEHYVPNDDDLRGGEFIGSMSDAEHVWDLALEAALGPHELWDRLEKDPTSLSADETHVCTRVIFAAIQVAAIGVEAARELEHAVRLFGDAAEAPPEFSPVWTAMDAFDPRRHGVDSRTRHIVAFYLLNVAGGLIDATGAFREYDDDGDPD